MKVDELLENIAKMKASLSDSNSFEKQQKAILTTLEKEINRALSAAREGYKENPKLFSAGGGSIQRACEKAFENSKKLLNDNPEVTVKATFILPGGGASLESGVTDHEKRAELIQMGKGNKIHEALAGFSKEIFTSTTSTFTEERKPRR